MNNDKSLLHKFMEYAIGSALTLLLGFFSSPIITRIINPDEFGKFSMFNMFVGISSIILTIGMDQSFVRFYYEEEEEKRSLLLRQTIKSPLVICCIYMFLITICRKTISAYLFDEYSLSAIILVVINCLIMLLNRYALLTLRMRQNGKLYSMMQVVQKAIYIVFIVGTFAIIGSTYLILLYATGISSLIVTIISILSYKKFWFPEKYNNNLKTTNRELLQYGIPLMFTSLITWVFQSADKMSIKHFSNYYEVGIYASAFSIIALLNQVQITFLNFWVPVAYEHFKNNNGDKEFYKKIFDLVTVCMFLLTISIVTCKDIIILLLGEKYRQASFIVPFLLFMPLMNTISEVTVIGIGFMKKTQYHIYITLVCSVVNVLGNIILVPLLGAKGAAISTGLTYLLFFIIRTFVASKVYYIGFEFKKFSTLTILTLGLILYSTFFKTNLILIVIGTSIFIITIVLYKKLIYEYLNVLLTKIKK